MGEAKRRKQLGAEPGKQDEKLYTICVGYTDDCWDTATTGPLEGCLSFGCNYILSAHEQIAYRSGREDLTPKEIEKIFDDIRLKCWATGEAEGVGYYIHVETDE